ncbi:hypothetical protein AB6A23_15570 [Paenibacillus tarimensis]
MLQHMFSICLEEMNSVNVVFDPKKCLVHVLEMDKGYKTPILESIESIQISIMERIKIYSTDCQEMTWFIYDLQGNINKYDHGSIEKLELDHPLVHCHFANKMKVRMLAVRSS